MAVQEKDIFVLGSATMPDDDTIENIGGALATRIKMTFLDINAPSGIKVRVQSESAADTGGVAIGVYGRDISGAKICSTLTLNGTASVSSTSLFERIMKVKKSSNAIAGITCVFAAATIQAGTVAATGSDWVQLASNASSTDNYYQFAVIRTVGGTSGANQFREIVKYVGSTKRAYVRNWGTALSSDVTYRVHKGVAMEMSPYHINQVRRPFYDAAANAAGGAPATYHEKVFVFNANSTKALTNAQIDEVDEGLYTKVSFAVDATLDSTTSNGAGNTRLEAGNLATKTFDSAIKSVANSGCLATMKGQGIWLRLELAAGDSAQNSFYKLQVSGQST